MIDRGRASETDRERETETETETERRDRQTDRDREDKKRGEPESIFSIIITEGINSFSFFPIFQSISFFSSQLFNYDPQAISLCLNFVSLFTLLF